jgi:hypothetical protein
MSYGNYQIANFLNIMFGCVQVQYRIKSRSRVHNLEFRIRILQKGSDPCGSGSATLYWTFCKRSRICKHGALGLTKVQTYYRYSTGSFICDTLPRYCALPYCAVLYHSCTVLYFIVMCSLKVVQVILTSVFDL